MQIALFSATGETGREALAQGHSVAALVRDPAKLADQAGLTKIPGDVLDQDPVKRSVAGADGVVCVLGSHRGRAPVEARGTERILAARRQQAVRRIIVVTSLGVGDSRSQLPWGIRLIMDIMLRSILRAKEEQEALVKASDLDWIIVRPDGLTKGPRTGAYRCGLDRSVKPGRVARADVADFVLRQLSDDTFLHQTMPSCSQGLCAARRRKSARRATF